MRKSDEWPWLRSLLTISKLKSLLGDDYKPEFSIDRFEMPNIHAVHFVIHGILEDGHSSSSIIDGRAKGLGEFLRARIADVPKKFADRGIVNHPRFKSHLEGIAEKAGRPK